MRQNCRHARLFPQVPDFDRVIVCACCKLETAWKEFHRHKLLTLVAGEAENILPRSKVPQQPNTVKITACNQRSIFMNRQRINGTTVAFLNQELLPRFNIPKSPCVVVGARSQMPTHGVKLTKVYRVFVSSQDR